MQEEVQQQNKNHLCVDHDHDTGMIRGLLCRPCNAFIGQMDEDVERIYRAAAYLEKSGMFRRLSNGN